MRLSQRLMSLVRNLFGKSRVEQELDAEVRAYLDELVEEKITSGMTPEDARREARIELGGVEQVKEKVREVRAGALLEQFWQDLRYGMRMLLRNKGWTAVALVSLALGIGANTALFSVVDAQLLKVLPVRDPEELVRFMWISGPNDMAVGISTYGYQRKDAATRLNTHHAFSYLTFERLRAGNQTLADVFAFVPIGQLNVVANGQAEIASGQIVSGNYFTGLGVAAVRGRTFTDDDDKPAAAPAAVISYGYWQRRFGLDPAVVGKTVNVNGVACTIIGITPREFSGALEIGSALPPDVSIPLAMEPLLGKTASKLNEPFTWWLLIMGRSKLGVTAEQVRANLEGVFQESALEGWNSYLALMNWSGRRDAPRLRDDAREREELARQRFRLLQEPRDTPRLRVLSGSQGAIDVNPDTRRALSIRIAVVGLVLMIVCANVANLLMARDATRQKEIAMRLALGASRLRLIRQLLTESTGLALLGGVIGTLLARWGKDLLLTFFQIDFTLDLRVLAFTAAISLLTAFLFGLAPALNATRVDLIPAIKDSGPNPGGTRSFLTKALLVAQVAMSLVLLIGAGLFVGTLRNLRSIDPGFNPENLLLFRVDPRLGGYEDARIASLYAQMVERIEALPGVRSATLSLNTLLSGNSASSDGTLSPRPGEIVFLQVVRSNFFDTLEMPIVLGRSVSPRDNGSAPKVAVINETLARRFYPNTNPLGQRIGGRPGGHRDIEIVGVVRDAKYETLRQEIPATVYLPYPQYPQFEFLRMNFEVRTAGDPVDLIPAIRQAIREVGPNLPLIDVKTQIEQVDQILAQERLFAFSGSLFGGLALLLACVGLYGILSFSVASRTQEIGIRMALGAERAQVIRLVMKEALWMVAIGVIVGLAASLAATRLIAGLLYGLAPNDVATTTIAISIMVAVAALAGFLPARKASRVDPMIALRYE